jgi:hypothetical protein
VVRTASAVSFESKLSSREFAMPMRISTVVPAFPARRCGRSPSLRHRYRADAAVATLWANGVGRAG